MARTIMAALLVALGAGAGAGGASAQCDASELRNMRDSGPGPRHVAELRGAADRQDHGPDESDDSDRDEARPDRFRPFFSTGLVTAGETAPACFSLLGRCRAAAHVPVGAPCLCDGHAAPAPGQAR